MTKVKTKACTQCKTSYSATTEYYHRRSAAPDGLHNECRKCRLNRQKIYQVKRKAAEAKAEANIAKAMARLEVANIVAAVSRIEAVMAQGGAK